MPEKTQKSERSGSIGPATIHIHHKTDIKRILNCRTDRGVAPGH